MRFSRHLLTIAIFGALIGATPCFAQELLPNDRSISESQIKLLSENNAQLREALEKTNTANQQQVQILTQNLALIQDRLNTLETRSLGPNSTPAQIQANAGLIQDLQSKTQGLLIQFNRNSVRVQAIVKEKELKPDMVQFYLAYGPNQQQIKNQLLDFERQLRTFDSAIIFPVLEPVALGPLESLTGFAKFKATALKTLNQQVDTLANKYIGLPSNQYTLQNPSKEDQQTFKANWNIAMSESKNPLATQAYHQKVIDQYNQVYRELTVFRSSYAQAQALGIEDSSISAKVSFINQVKIFGKVSPEELAKTAEIEYSNNTPIEIDNSSQEFQFWFVVVLSLAGATVIGITLWKVYSVTSNKIQSED